MTVANVSTSPANPATSPPATTPKTAISSDFQTFLKMLTAQLQNQDPLNPMDNSEYAVQLATFSGVEQQVRTNSLLEGLGGQLGVLGLSQLAGWVGRQGRAEMPVWFDGAPVELNVTPNTLADASELVVTDSTGKVVARQQVPPGEASFSWSGQDSFGEPMPEGRYSLAVDTYSAGIKLDTRPVESYAEIIEARAGSSGTILVFKGGIEVSASQITALRAE
ncbi:MAG: flagellar basal body rod modification protein [Cereibacter sphaeroides]|uniref:Basal-body rod modification protein FlgD n=1 Tax=Cereibacter sphaeroides TaxID=1063 RepID=A0A2W5SE62_CERSP|nr:MAG: flagellar basal body rod modification protein [Cereibacter sphaeroides]